MRPNREEMLAGIRRGLAEFVAPEVSSVFGRAQLGYAANLLQALAREADDAVSSLVEENGELRLLLRRAGRRLSADDIGDGGLVEELRAVALARRPDLRLSVLRAENARLLALFVRLSRQGRPASPADVPITTIIPAFLISELKTSFQIGFMLFIPFLIVDMVIASVLLSLGMMMLPPILISLPFKLMLFVMVDGWALLVGSLMQSFI